MLPFLSKMKIVKNETFDLERALYALDDALVLECTFAGPADGESVLKEAKNIKVDNCSFSLRYPLWHNHNFELINSRMDELCRAPMWYCKDGLISKCNIKGVKAVRECEKIEIKDSIIESTEFGWKSSDIKISDSKIISEYLFFDSKNVTLKNVEMKGKYSFQYIDGLIIDDSNLDTKDAFWHSKNVMVRNSIIKGEYLAWFSENLTLINCKIIGTQPFCYCKKLKLINCEMINCDLAFEYSEVEADIIGKVDSIKNPLDGIIKVDEVGEIIHDNPVYPCKGKVVIK